MDIKEFTEIVEKIVEKEDHALPWDVDCRVGKVPTEYYKEENNDPNCLYIKWETGGYSGGSCWDDSDPQPYQNNSPEPNFTALVKVLEYFTPEISFLKGMQFTNMVKNSTYTDHEYYGNSTDYAVKYVEISTMYGFFHEEGVFGE